MAVSPEDDTSVRFAGGVNQNSSVTSYPKLIEAELKMGGACFFSFAAMMFSMMWRIRADQQ